MVWIVNYSVKPLVPIINLLLVRFTQDNFFYYLVLDTTIGQASPPILQALGPLLEAMFLVNSPLCQAFILKYREARTKTDSFSLAPHQFNASCSVLENMHASKYMCFERNSLLPQQMKGLLF